MITRMKMHENRSNMNSIYDGNDQYIIATSTQSQSTTNLKRPLSLDLNAATNNNKLAGKKRAALPSIVLNTPDLNMLKMNTPDLEKFIISNVTTLQTPTPGCSTVIPFRGTLEQEEYARGFTEALNNIREKSTRDPIQHNNNVNEFSTKTGAINSNPAITATSTPTSTILSTVGMSGGSVTYTNLDNSYPVTIKNEPQTVPNSPPVSPINMDNQEKIKLERKRQRNRVAASKCRKKKLERISKLEDKVKMLKGENTELSGVVKSMKAHVIQLKEQVIHHVQNGCSLPTYNGSFYARATVASDI